MVVGTRRRSYLIQVDEDGDENGDATVEEDNGGDKDMIIANLRAQNRELINQNKSLTEALIRERDINDAFLELRKKYKSSKDVEKRDDDDADSVREAFPPNQAAGVEDIDKYVDVPPSRQLQDDELSETPHTTDPSGTPDSSHHENPQEPEDDGFKQVPRHKSQRTTEDRRVYWCKGALYSLKRYMPPSVQTVILSDSGARGIRDEQLDGDGKSCVLKVVGGLCIPAAIKAMSGASELCFPHVKSLILSVGANDILHSHDHPNIDRIGNFQELDKLSTAMFPNARIHYIVPFRDIKNIGPRNEAMLTEALENSGVTWAIHYAPPMRGKLQGPDFVHIKKNKRQFLISWIQTEFQLMPPKANEVLSSQPQPHTESQRFPPNGPSFRVSRGVSDQDSGWINSLEPMVKDRILELLVNQTRYPPDVYRRTEPSPWINHH